MFGGEFAARRARADGGGPEAPGNNSLMVFVCCFCLLFVYVLFVVCCSCFCFFGLVFFCYIKQENKHTLIKHQQNNKQHTPRVSCPDVMTSRHRGVRRIPLQQNCAPPASTNLRRPTSTEILTNTRTIHTEAKHIIFWGLGTPAMGSGSMRSELYSKHQPGRPVLRSLRDHFRFLWSFRDHFVCLGWFSVTHPSSPPSPPPTMQN
jgi:hypothetical protein